MKQKTIKKNLFLVVVVLNEYLYEHFILFLLITWNNISGVWNKINSFPLNNLNLDMSLFPLEIVAF